MRFELTEATDWTLISSTQFVWDIADGQPTGLGKKDNLFKARFWNGRGSVTSFLVPCSHGGGDFCRSHLIYRDGRVRNIRDLDRAREMRNG